MAGVSAAIAAWTSPARQLLLSCATATGTENDSSLQQQQQAVSQLACLVYMLGAHLPVCVQAC
jgi:hypothetical protein